MHSPVRGSNKNFVKRQIPMCVWEGSVDSIEPLVTSEWTIAIQQQWWRVDGAKRGFFWPPFADDRPGIRPVEQKELDCTESVSGLNKVVFQHLIKEKGLLIKDHRLAIHTPQEWSIKNREHLLTHSSKSQLCPIIPGH